MNEEKDPTGETDGGRGRKIRKCGDAREVNNKKEKEKRKKKKEKKWRRSKVEIFIR